MTSVTRNICKELHECKECRKKSAFLMYERGFGYYAQCRREFGGCGRCGGIAESKKKEAIEYWNKY